MDGAPGVDASTEMMFPGPSIDLWYELMLSIPKAPKVDPNENVLRARRPIEVTTYQFQDDRDNARILDCIRNVESIATSPELSQVTISPARIPDTWPEDMRTSLSTYRFDQATRILMEGPVFSMSPPVDSGVWNFATLTDRIPSSVDGIDMLSRAPCGPIPLENVFVQFSPLEWPAWEKISEGHQIDLLRGLWLVQKGKSYVMYVFHEGFPTKRVVVHGPTFYQFIMNRFQFWYDHRWIDATGQGMFDLPLIVTLDLLGNLSLDTKVDPISTWHFAGTSWYPETMIGSKARFHLVKVLDPEIPDYWYVVRDVEYNKPFTRMLLGIQDTQRKIT